MAFVLSSLSGNLISAASAGFAPTNSADVSAIASAYQVVSATATQLNAGTAYLTSVNETPISASRAGNAVNATLATSAWYDGTGRLISSLPDEATVSSIASAYAESAASGKQDTSAMSSYALSADVSGVIDTVSSNSASWAGGITGDYLTAKVGSGQATFSTAFQDGMEKRPSLVISAERSAGAKMYPRMMVTDWNGTTGDTHSGMLLANAFEFYICPQSARGQVDPSGLVQSRLDASQLQFNIDSAVSSFTRSSEFTRSGMRLGKSANTASWVSISGNGNSGGFITLDDGSGTSGRIVASSIPYWNDKLDGSASSSYYTTANESGYVDSAYVESQVSSKQDTLTFDWDSNSAISSINGSALAGQGGGGGGSPIVVTGTAWDPDTSAWVYNLTSNLSAAERHAWTFQNGYNWDYIEYLKDDSGNRFPMMAYFLAAGAEQMYYGGINGNGRLQFSPKNSMFTADSSNVYGLSPLTFATGASMNLSAGYFRASYRGDTIFISRGPLGTIDSSNSSQIKAVRIEAHNSRGANISAYGANSTGYFGDTGMRLSHTGVFVDDSGNSSNTASNLTLTTGSIKFNSAGSSDTMSQSSIPYWNGKADSSALSSYVPYSSLEYNTASAISGINGSALAAGSTYSAGEGIDITDDVISVEAPVDIVAGPGIVIDNPDGNTLRVSMASDYEVEVYYSPNNHNVENTAEFTMSESLWNFKKAIVTFDNMEFQNRTCTMLIDLAVSDTGTLFCTPFCNGDNPGTLNIPWARFTINSSGNIKYSNRGLIYGTWTSPAYTTGTSRGYRVKRVVGIHRINGGN